MKSNGNVYEDGFVFLKATRSENTFATFFFWEQALGRKPFIPPCESKNCRDPCPQLSPEIKLRRYANGDQKDIGRIGVVGLGCGAGRALGFCETTDTLAPSRR
jgi:hypothetical protein